MNIIGISALYHDSACCLLQDGELRAAAQEERFTRIKHDSSMPFKSLDYCLRTTGLSITDIDCLAYYENPEKKFSRQLWSYDNKLTLEQLNKLNPLSVERAIREELGYEGDIQYIDHHLSHAASAFFFSGFESSAIMTIDGVGEWATMTYGKGDQKKGIDIFEEVLFPHSIGLLYSTITSFLGFEVNEGEYKVMGLAPYGKPVYADKLRTLFKNSEGGQFQLNMHYFDFVKTDCMFSTALEDLLGFPARTPGSTLHQYHKDIARSLQLVLEEILLEKASYLHRVTQAENLCLAGGVALNCVANGRIKREGPYQQLFIQPAANDSGAALGAAAMASFQRGCMPSQKPLQKVYLGPQYSSDQIDQTLKSTSLKYHNYTRRPEEIAKLTAQKIAEGKVIGWFQGGMEFGPRALGARSILADPRNPIMRDKINAMVKKRESFRPFAPVVLEDKCHEHFDMKGTSPFMLETCQVISPLDLPAITHVDNSARVQTVNAVINPPLAALLEEFYAITGCPILLNTSFNVKGEPIVCTPYNAIRCFIAANMDCLILGDYFIDRSENNTGVLDFIVKSYNMKMSGIRHDVYTFL